MNRARKVMVLAAGLATLASTGPAWATLGENVDSVQADAVHLKTAATTRTTSRPALFTVQRLTLSNSTVVDEYVSASGLVFAVSWSGPRPPDLERLFGSYYAEYQAAATQPHLRRSQAQIDTGRMTYHAGGHMRSLWGSAQVPSLLPAGVIEGDLQ